MKQVFLCVALALGVYALGQRMDASIGGKTAGHSSEPVYDSRQRLYLYGSGD